MKIFHLMFNLHTFLSTLWLEHSLDTDKYNAKITLQHLLYQLEHQLQDTEIQINMVYIISGYYLKK